MVAVVVVRHGAVARRHLDQRVAADEAVGPDIARREQRPLDPEQS